jgi:hypothetical protein
LPIPAGRKRAATAKRAARSATSFVRVVMDSPSVVQIPGVMLTGPTNDAALQQGLSWVTHASSMPSDLGDTIA